jgi:cytochrome b involved in lipid metabolism
MKKEVITGVIITICVVFFIFFIASSYQTKNSFTNTTNITPQAVNTYKTLTISEVAQHNSQSDCYIIIAGKVYDVTNYIDSHPGGPVIVEYCGRDATEAYNTKNGRGRPHSDLANQLLKDYYIGNLK